MNYEQQLKEQVISYPEYKRLTIKSGQITKPFFSIIKFVVTCIILLSSIVGYSQASCMGCNVSEVIKTGAKFDERHENGTTTYLYGNEEYSILYVVYENVIVEQMVMCSRSLMYKLVETLNDKYIKISSTQWGMFVGDIPITITLSYYDKNDHYILTWKGE